MTEDKEKRVLSDADRKRYDEQFKEMGRTLKKNAVEPSGWIAKTFTNRGALAIDSHDANKIHEGYAEGNDDI